VAGGERKAGDVGDQTGGGDAAGLGHASDAAGQSLG
jgi:hypothetical protein